MRKHLALISVYDKRGIAKLAGVLIEAGYEIASTGGTKKLLEDAGLAVTEVGSISGNPEGFGGRMKTISFAIESGILFDRKRDGVEASKLGIRPIDIVVCNFYPFTEYKDKIEDLRELIEYIDIGGPTMVRAAAKNFESVAVITDPSDYDDVIKELNARRGELSIETRTKLMRKSFNYTADYDSQIAVELDRRSGDRSKRLAFEKAVALRYGENPHQTAFYLRKRGAKSSMHDMRILQGKEISYNNIVDIYAAFETAALLNRFGCAIIKHNTPCGMASAKTQNQAFEAAWEGDRVSAFGSIIAFNSELEANTAAAFCFDDPDRTKRKFIEVVVAPKIRPEALKYLSLQKNLRVVEVEIPSNKEDYRILGNSVLIQQHDDISAHEFNCVTDRGFDVDRELCEFGITAAKQVRSNAIVIVRRLPNNALQMTGSGTGQPNRLNSSNLALLKFKENIKNEFKGNESDFETHLKKEMGRALMVSDAFFPFPDSIEEAAKDSIRNILQPGGSIRDKEVIEACNRLGIAMAFTGTRHFKH